MDTWKLVWLACAGATVYPYYRLAYKPLKREQWNRRKIDAAWRDFDLASFALLSILMWPVALLTIAVAVYVRRVERREPRP